MRWAEWVSEFLQSARGMDRIRPPSRQATEDKLAALRGRGPYFGMLPSGRGSGAYLEFEDGSVKLDLITSIGIHFWGHQHPELLLAGAKALNEAPAMPGTLLASQVYSALLESLRDSLSASHLSESARMPFGGGWLTSCGTMANEAALRIARQKAFPRYKVIAFSNAFAGRSSTMQELTDEPNYRVDQPDFGQVFRVGFYRPELDLYENINVFEKEFARVTKDPDVGVLWLEPIQGEGGGFRGAPEEWWRAVLGSARKQNLAICFDEVQSFYRTGEVFAFQRLGLAEFVDVVSFAKPLLAGGVIWRPELNPRGLLLGGTFVAHSVALAQGLTGLSMLRSQNFLGAGGRIMRFEKLVREDFEKRQKRHPNLFRRWEVWGGMIALEVGPSTDPTAIRAIVKELFADGVVCFTAGRNPVMLRFLPPLGVLGDDQWVEGMDVLERILQKKQV